MRTRESYWMIFCYRALGAGLFALMLPIAVIDSAPTHGHRRDQHVEIGAGQAQEFLETYRGGQRACVIVAAQARAGVVLRIDVYNAHKERIVAVEQPALAAAIWYPPREGQYRVRIENRGAVSAICSIAWK